MKKANKNSVILTGNIFGLAPSGGGVLEQLTDDRLNDELEPEFDLFCLFKELLLAESVVRQALSVDSFIILTEMIKENSL